MEQHSAYVYNGPGELLGGWPGQIPEAAPELGENWWKIIVPRIASESPFSVIFSDGMNQTDDVEITDGEIVYVTAASGLYASAPEAEAAMANDNEEIGNTDDPNPDLAAYDVTFEETGAVLPYITYEAEDARINGQVLPYSMTYVEDIQSEASGRQAVKLSATGAYVEFTLTEPANSLVLRYCIPDSADGTGIDATLSLYVDGIEKQDLNLTSRYQWVYGSYPYTNIPSQGSPHRFFDEVRVLFGQTYAAGATIRLQKDGADTARYYIIDFIEGEEVGAGVSFHYQGTCRFFDFAMTGIAAVRDDSGDLAAFEGGGKSNAVTIQNIWMEHVKVGVWNYNASNLVVQGCRIRNTFADGINLCSGSVRTTVRNNNVRNTGDDGIAIWPWMADCTDNIIAYNTVQIPTLANNIALYGGNGNVVEYNRTYDTIFHGAGVCIGSEFATKKQYSGTTTVRYNVLERSGSYHGGYGYPLGAIWFWSTTNPMNADFQVYENRILSPYAAGVVVDCRNDLTGVNLTNNSIEDGTEGMYVRGYSAGHADVTNLTYRATADGWNDGKDLVDGQMYHYRVIGYFTDEQGNLFMGDMSDAVIAIAAGDAPEAMGTVTAQQSEEGVTLSWDPVAGLRYYKVSRASGTDGSYRCLQYNIEPTTYTDTTVENGRYRYKVVGYYKATDGSWVYGELSDTIYVTVK